MAGTKNALKLRIYHSTSPLLINVSEHAQVAITDPSSVRWHQRNLMVAEVSRRQLAAAVDNFTAEPSGGGRGQFHRRAIWQRRVTTIHQSHVGAPVDDFTAEPSGGGR